MIELAFIIKKCPHFVPFLSPLCPRCPMWCHTIRLLGFCSFPPLSPSYQRVAASINSKTCAARIMPSLGE
jgi:hypothetical protein